MNSDGSDIPDSGVVIGPSVVSPIQHLPPCCQDPLRILQYYLASLGDNRGESSSEIDKWERDKKHQHRQDEILRTVDFLFGGSILEGALTVLDSGESLITRVVSISSQRSLYLVKGSSPTRNRGSSSPAEYYLCLVPNDDEAPYQDSSSVFYCSCRSFLERSRSSTSICKHLLALTLMAPLGVKVAVLETMSDEEFSNFVVSRLGV